jgi:hypothetical protein
MLLFHYTDQNGFMGIVRNTELWATKIQYLNDSSEFYLATNIAKQILQEMIVYEEDKDVVFRMRRFICSLDNIKHINVCVCSLSEEGDLLSQWRGYAKQQGGYSIAFEKNMLDQILNAQDYDLKACVYDTENQKNLIKNHIQKSLEKYHAYPEPSGHDPKFGSDSSFYFKMELARIAPLIKDSSFSEEREWRIISRGGVHVQNLSFRAGTSMLIPFHRIKLIPDFWNLIKRVTVGHTPHAELARDATDSFLYQQAHCASKRQELDTRDINVQVRNSVIPYRSW